MCTGYDYSAYQILKTIEFESKTLQQINRELGDERFFLNLGPGMNVRHFMERMKFEHFVDITDNTAYGLNSEGEKYLHKLKDITAGVSI